MHFPKHCDCGGTTGMYIDEINANYSGRYAVPLGIDNNSFIDARNNIGQTSTTFEAFIIPKNCETFKKVKKVSDV
jgi:hypothetical protein